MDAFGNTMWFEEQIGMAASELGRLENLLAMLRRSLAHQDSLFGRVAAHARIDREVPSERELAELEALIEHCRELLSRSERVVEHGRSLVEGSSAGHPRGSRAICVTPDHISALADEHAQQAEDFVQATTATRQLAESFSVPWVSSDDPGNDLSEALRQLAASLSSLGELHQQQSAQLVTVSRAFFEADNMMASVIRDDAIDSASAADSSGPILPMAHDDATESLASEPPAPEVAPPSPEDTAGLAPSSGSGFSFESESILASEDAPSDGLGSTGAFPSAPPQAFELASEPAPDAQVTTAPHPTWYDDYQFDEWAVDQPSPHCPKCGAPVHPGNAFCPTCGSMLSHSSSAPAPDADAFWAAQPDSAPTPPPSYSMATPPLLDSAPAAPAQPQSAPKKPGLFGRIRERIRRRKVSEQPTQQFEAIVVPPQEEPADTPASPLGGLPNPAVAPGPAPAYVPAPASVASAAPAMSDVRFVTVAPARLARTTYANVDVVMHEPGFEEAVQQVAAEHEEPTRTTDGGWIAAARGTRVRVDLTSPELGSLGSEEAIWQGRYLRLGFMFSVPAEAPDQVAFCAAVSFDGVPATRLRFVLACDDSTPRHLPEQRLTPERTDIRSAFISYASQDRSRVATIIQGMRVARPDLDIFFDVERLRSGQQWEQALRDEIGRSDVLYLCWSRSARESQWVDFEWRYAYENKGEEVIEPVAIDPPSVCPPPPELSDKHFNDFLLYVIDAPSLTTE